jgi:hypothetical protein
MGRVARSSYENAFLGIFHELSAIGSAQAKRIQFPQIGLTGEGRGDNDLGLHVRRGAP